MKFGVFLAPFHRADENPTLAIDRDLELVQLLDHLGFDEAWIGEHHSAGWEIIADPAVFIAAAAQRTRTIRLGTGVYSLPYHQPLILADRMVLLDHMTRGRAMLGVGPGALTSDAYMLGIDATTQRPRMEEALTAILALLEAREPVSMTTDWFTLKEARLQLASYSDPHLPVAVAAAVSPSGPTAAGKHGIGVLSLATHQEGGLDVLQRTWAWVERAAAESGKTVDRADWRVVLPFHLAESREEAIRDVRAGQVAFSKTYFEETLGRPAGDPDDLIERTLARGGAIVGTPDDAIEAVERLLAMSGGFGGLMGLAHEWASRERTYRSFELWARYVAPRFQGQFETKMANRNWVAANKGEIFAESKAAVANAFTDAGIEMPPDAVERVTATRPGIV
jgi:limonene 1,2-monooxygenase